MRILFYSRGIESLGVEYLMAYLKKNGHKVELIFDPGLDNNLYYKIKILKYFNRWDKLIQKAVEWKPDIVAFSALTNSFPYTLEFLKLLKKYINVLFVFGGIHATALPEYVLENDEIDYVIRGEGELALSELVSCLEKNKSINNIKNLCYKENGNIKINLMRPLIKNLDILPFPYKESYYKARAFKTTLNIITSRGCPFKCTYCINNFYKKKLLKNISKGNIFLRRRSPENVIEEIKENLKKYPIEHILFNDDAFIISPKWVNKFLDLYIDEIKNISFSFCYHHKFINSDIAGKLSKAGATYANGAIETANDYLRKNILKRNETDEEILKAMNILQRNNIKVATSAIFGIPFETRESRWETVNLVEKSNTDMINTYLMYPFPGTEILEIARKNGYLTDKGYLKVKQGLSSYHQESLFENMDIENASTIAKLLPLYIKGPRFLKVVVRFFMKKNIPNIAHFIYIFTSPFLYSGWTKKWIGDLLRMFFYSIIFKNKK